MRWTIKHGNILNEPADVLICSANPFLNLSGGVGVGFWANAAITKISKTRMIWKNIKRKISFINGVLDSSN